MDEQQETRMSLTEHFEELRSCLLWALGGLFVSVIVCWFFKHYFMKVVIWPLHRTNFSKELMALSPMERIVQYLKVDIIFGMVFASPWIAYHMWSFIGAGLYEEERNVTYTYAGGSLFLFLSGVAFSYFLMFPLVTDILLSFDPSNVSKQELQFSEYINFFFKTTLAMGAAFQIPLLMKFLSSMGAVKRSSWKSYRKYAIVGTFVVAAMITPPDPISQLSAALPMILLYEIGILLIPSTPEDKMENNDSV